MTLFGKENFFKYNELRRYTVLFGQLFSDLHILRETEDKQTFIKVPLKYGRGYVYEKFGDNDDKKTRMRIVLPAMSFVLTQWDEDGSRKTNTYNKLASRKIGDDNKVNTQFGRVPYNFTYELAVRTKNIDDMNQIMEQIIPAFSPALTVKCQDNDELDVQQDITIQMLPGVEMEDTEEEQIDVGRVITWTINFVVKGYLYKRTNREPVVLQVEVNNFMPDGFQVEQMFSTVISAISPQKQLVNAQAKAVEGELFGGLQKKKTRSRKKSLGA